MLPPCPHVPHPFVFAADRATKKRRQLVTQNTATREACLHEGIVLRRGVQQCGDMTECLCKNGYICKILTCISPHTWFIKPRHKKI